MKIFRAVTVLAVLILVTPPASAYAGGAPTAQLRATIDEFVAILASTPVAELRTKGLPERALTLIFGRFDFAEMTRRSLGQHWIPLDALEQREFVEAFTQRLLMAYGRSVRASGDERIRYEREAIDRDQATVETRVVSGGSETMEIDYRMHSVEGQWKVYDMVVDHVSLVENYRAQFERVIARSSVKELLQRMKRQES
jgi:phospholipid transport system substrate-binding protein